MLKKIAHYAQNYAHVKELCLKSDCSIRVYVCVSKNGVCSVSVCHVHNKCVVCSVSVITIMVCVLLVCVDVCKCVKPVMLALCLMCVGTCYTLCIMLALCLMLLGTYYAQNYAGIIGRSLVSARKALIIWTNQQITLPVLT